MVNKRLHMSSISTATQPGGQIVDRLKSNFGCSADALAMHFAGVSQTHYTKLSARTTYDNVIVLGCSRPESSGEMRLDRLGHSPGDMGAGHRTWLIGRREDDTGFLVNHINWPVGSPIEWPKEAQQRLSCIAMLSHL